MLMIKFSIGHSRNFSECIRTVQSDFRIDYLDGDKLLFAFTPRSIEHARKIWTLTEIDFVQTPNFPQCHDRYIGVLLFDVERLVNVLRRCQ